MQPNHFCLLELGEVALTHFCTHLTDLFVLDGILALVVEHHPLLDFVVLFVLLRALHGVSGAAAGVVPVHFQQLLLPPRQVQPRVEHLLLALLLVVGEAQCVFLGGGGVQGIPAGEDSRLSGLTQNNGGEGSSY